MKQAGQMYVHGNLAEKIQYDVYEENKILKSKKKARNNFKTKIKLVGLVLIAFSLCFLIMFRYAQITELNYDINKVNKKLTDIKNRNSAMKVSIERSMDLAKVREVAETKLGMHKPDKYQIVYIKVPKPDFTNVPKKQDANANLLETVTQKAKLFLNFIY